MERTAIFLLRRTRSNRR